MKKKMLHFLQVIIIKAYQELFKFAKKLYSNVMKKRQTKVQNPHTNLNLNMHNLPSLNYQHLYQMSNESDLQIQSKTIFWLLVDIIPFETFYLIFHPFPLSLFRQTTYQAFTS